MIVDRKQLESECFALGRKLKQELEVQPHTQNVGFALVLFDYGAAGNMAFVSTAQRMDCIALLKELIGKLEAN